MRSVFLIHVKLLSECVLISRKRKKSNKKKENRFYVFNLLDRKTLKTPKNRVLPAAGAEKMVFWVIKINKNTPPCL